MPCFEFHKYFKYHVFIELYHYEYNKTKNIIFKFLINKICLMTYMKVCIFYLPRCFICRKITSFNLTCVDVIKANIHKPLLLSVYTVVIHYNINSANNKLFTLTTFTLINSSFIILFNGGK